MHKTNTAKCLAKLLTTIRPNDETVLDADEGYYPGQRRRVYVALHNYKENIQGLWSDSVYQYV